MIVALIVFLLMGGVVLEAAKPIAHRTIGPEKPHPEHPEHLPKKGGITKRRGNKSRTTKRRRV